MTTLAAFALDHPDRVRHGLGLAACRLGWRYPYYSREWWTRPRRVGMHRGPAHKAGTAED